MRIAILGSGCGGLFLSLLLKIKHPMDEIFVFDKNQVIGRKLYVTGNGRCNLGNTVVNEYSYNNDFAYELIKETNLDVFIKFLSSIGVETRNLENLVYPYSLSAKAFVDYLIEYAKKIGVNFINNEKVLDYKIDGKNIIVITDKSRGSFDRFCISCGGKSHAKLGSDGTFFDVLKKHGYDVKPMCSGLAPIKTKESTKEVENERVKANVSLYQNEKFLYSEEGEVLFKNDGLSGICIMNISSLISRKKDNDYKIKIDLFPEFSIDQLESKILAINNCETYKVFDGIFSKKIARYILKNIKFKNKNNIEQFDANLISNCVKNLTFTVDTNYGFDDSQVSIGGVSLNELKPTLESVKEANVYMLGEMLDIDGLCGGYNIMICFAEAMRISNYL